MDELEGKSADQVMAEINAAILDVYNKASDADDSPHCAVYDGVMYVVPKEKGLAGVFELIANSKAAQ